MISLTELADVYRQGKTLYEEMMNTEIPPHFEAAEGYGTKQPSGTDRMGEGDNLRYMAHLLHEKKLGGRIQLIYVDPPFFSKGQYQTSVRLESERLGKSPLMKLGAYDDRWAQGFSQYLAMLTARFFAMRDLLADTGCLWVHLDWHAVHYVKILLDQIFGQEHFINEVIWSYKSGGATKRSFAKKHDTLLLYGKTAAYAFQALREKSYNRGLKPYRFKDVEEFQDEHGWYTLVNMKDVWNIDMVGRTSAERTGYATQKPEKLMERIIASCSSEGDLCADFFAGSGTFGAVCQRMNRRWIMCDEGRLSLSGQICRLAELGGSFLVEREMDARENDAVGMHAEPVSCGGKIICSISGDAVQLVHYTPPSPEEPEGMTPEISRYLEDDSLSLIKCWSVDDDFDGIVHRSRRVLPGKERVCALEKKKRDVGTRQISIRGYDMLGNAFSEIIHG